MGTKSQHFNFMNKQITAKSLLESAHNILLYSVTPEDGEDDVVDDWMEDYMDYCQHCGSDQMPINEQKFRDCGGKYYEAKKSRTKQAVINCCQDWINAGMGDECFWEEWIDCPTEYNLTPNMIIKAIYEK